MVLRRTRLAGPSGAGKTTLLNLLSLMPLGGTAEGEVTFNGAPMTDRLFREHMSIVSQEVRRGIQERNLGNRGALFRWRRACTLRCCRGRQARGVLAVGDGGGLKMAGKGERAGAIFRRGRNDIIAHALTNLTMMAIVSRDDDLRGQTRAGFPLWAVTDHHRSATPL